MHTYTSCTGFHPTLEFDLLDRRWEFETSLHRPYRAVDDQLLKDDGLLGTVLLKAKRVFTVLHEFKKHPILSVLDGFRTIIDGAEQVFYCCSFSRVRHQAYANDNSHYADSMSVTASANGYLQP